MAIKKSIYIKVTKALSKEDRQWLALQIHGDEDLRNAINGVGGLSVFSDKARIQGLITKNLEPLLNAKIQVFKDNIKLYEVTTNQHGYFKQNIIPGTCNIKIIGKEQEHEMSIKIIKGLTSTINYDFRNEETST